jgi:hypothetical protein
VSDVVGDVEVMGNERVVEVVRSIAMARNVLFCAFLLRLW